MLLGWLHRKRKRAGRALRYSRLSGVYVADDFFGVRCFGAARFAAAFFATGFFTSAFRAAAFFIGFFIPRTLQGTAQWERSSVVSMMASPHVPISFLDKKFKPIGACSGYSRASLFLPGLSQPPFSTTSALCQLLTSPSSLSFFSWFGCFINWATQIAA